MTDSEGSGGGHVVVDGSNIATEGRSQPSLEQLDEAVRSFLEEHPHDTLTVVVLFNTAGPVNPQTIAREIAAAVLGKPAARPRLREGAPRYAFRDAPQVTAIGPPFDPVPPLIGAGEKM